MSRPFLPIACAFGALLVLPACGGGSRGAEPSAEAASGADAPLRSVAEAAVQGHPTLWVRASALVAGELGVGMAVRVDGVERGRTELRSLSAQDVPVPLPAPPVPGTRIDVVHLHGGNVAGVGPAAEDRALRVASIRIDDGASLPATEARLDLGAGEAAFDGQDLHPGQPLLWQPGALRFVWPAVLPVDLGGARVTVLARASLARGRGARMSVSVNGLPLSPAGVEVRNEAALQPYRFSAAEALPAGARVDVAYTNDEMVDRGGGLIEDRNLVVTSIQVDDGPPLAAEQATLDLGAGAAAFDGIDLRPGQPVLPWNGALRFPLAGPAVPGGPQGVSQAARAGRSP